MAKSLATLIAWALIAVFATNAYAAITTAGNITGGGTPYTGQDPWNTSNLIVGNSAPGSMIINAGSKVSNSGIGQVSFTGSSVTVDGSGSKWTNTGDMYLGSGTMNITNAGSVTDNTGYISISGGNFAVTVDGAGSNWTSQLLAVGDGGTGSLLITNGGSVTSASTYLGTDGVGSVTIGGGTGNSRWGNNAGGLYVGYTNGTGTLNIVGGGSVFSAGGTVGGNSGFLGKGIVNVGGGSGSASWTNSSDLNIGQYDAFEVPAPSELNITGGGTVSNVNAYIGLLDSTFGTVTVGGGTGSAVWTCSGSLTVAANTGATAVLNINTGGTVSAASLDGGSPTSGVNFNGGTLSITGTDSASNTITFLAAGGTIDVPTNGTTLTMSSAIGGVGGLTKTGAATLVLTGANTYQGGTTVSGGTLSINNTSGSGTGTGSIAVNSGGTLAGTGSATGAVTVNAGGKIAPGNSVGTLSIGGLTLASSTSTMAIELNASTTPAADLLNVTGGVALNGGALNLSFLNGPTSFDVPKTILIVANDLADAVSGTFGSISGVPNGYVVTVNYAYAGTDALGRIGTGNDVAVTVFSAVPEASAVAMWGVVLMMIGGVGVYRKCQVRA